MSSSKKTPGAVTDLADTHLTDARIKTLAKKANDPSSRTSQIRFTIWGEKGFV